MEPGVRRVLVVEDDVTIAASIAARLRAEGFTVDVAHDGPAAVEADAASRHLPLFALTKVKNVPVAGGAAEALLAPTTPTSPVAIRLPAASHTDCFICPLHCNKGVCF